LKANNSIQLENFDQRIRERIASIGARDRCIWCKSPGHSVKTKGLCSSCYKWDKEQRQLAMEVSKLPPRIRKDPYSNLRHELDVANEAIKLCKLEGDVLDIRLEQTSSIELEETFHALSVETLGRKRGLSLFDRKADYFYDFSDMQKIWVWYLVNLIQSEIDRRDRRGRARSNVIGKMAES